VNCETQERRSEEVHGKTERGRARRSRRKQLAGPRMNYDPRNRSVQVTRYCLWGGAELSDEGLLENLVERFLKFPGKKGSRIHGVVEKKKGDEDKKIDKG